MVPPSSFPIATLLDDLVLAFGERAPSSLNMSNTQSQTFSFSSRYLIRHVVLLHPYFLLSS